LPIRSATATCAFRRVINEKNTLVNGCATASEIENLPISEEGGLDLRSH
jgi:hypothetical protein